MNKRFFRSLQFSLTLLDFLSLNVVFFLTEYIFQRNELIVNNQEYTNFIFLINIAWLAAVVLKNIYNERYIISFELFSRVSMHAFVYFVLIISTYLFFFRMILLSRLFILVVLGAICIIFLINRLLYLMIYHYYKRNEHLTSKVVIIGYNDLSKKLATYFDEDRINKEIIGFCEESENIHELSRYPILSNISGALSVCKQFGATEIYSTIAPEQNKTLYKLIQGADENCIRFKIVPDLGYFFKRQMHIDYINEIPVISVRKEPLEDLGNRIKKRVADVIVSFFVVCFILTWLIPLLGLLICLESKGPIFFAQPRTGKNNKKFFCLKFRSMKQNSTADVQQATRNDLRITRIGKFLRRTSLDEFPQFINVLKGDMSLVGPRPHMLKHTDEYSRLIGQYMVRQLLKPGITGWAQINGHRGETQTILQMEKRIEHDLWYIEHWSLLLDLKILVLTISHIFKGNKNAF